MLSVIDAIVAPIYLVLILLWAKWYQNKMVLTKPEYKYYVTGLVAKIGGALAVSFIYIFYYKGGDTINFYQYGSSIMYKLFFLSPVKFFDVVFGERTEISWNYFNNETGWPYYFRDPNSFFVTRLISPLTLISFNSYLSTAILLATICYAGVWRLYIVFVEVYPKLYKSLAFAILFIPSVVFWGSGILKDTITFAGIGWYTYCFYRLFIQRRFNIKYMLGLFIASYLILSIKPYILYTLIPGSLVWLNSQYLFSVKDNLKKFLITPLLIFVLGGIAYLLIIQLGSHEGKYALSTILERAVITQRDLRMDYYKGNSFDIGDFDATLAGVLGKAHIAIISGLFRPFIWEVKNPFMLLSAFENLFFAYFSIVLLLSKPRRVILIIFNNPLIFFSVLFALFFSFSVGLTTANFGSLVRYRIPAIPFFLGSIFIIKDLLKEKQEKNLKS